MEAALTGGVGIVAGVALLSVDWTLAILDVAKGAVAGPSRTRAPSGRPSAFRRGGVRGGAHGQLARSGVERADLIAH